MGLLNLVQSKSRIPILKFLAEKVFSLIFFSAKNCINFSYCMFENVMSD